MSILDWFRVPVRAPRVIEPASYCVGDLRTHRFLKGPTCVRCGAANGRYVAPAVTELSRAEAMALPAGPNPFAEPELPNLLERAE